MINPYEIVARVLAGFEAEPQEPPTTRTTADESRAVGILQVKDSPARGVDSWATVEASAFETPFRTPDGRGVRVEFVAAVDGRLDQFGDAVAASAFEIDPANDVKPGTVYRGAVSNAYPDAATPHLFSVSPFIWDAGFEQYDDDDVHVTWLQLVPITADEADLVIAHGPAALEDAFVRAQPDLFSIDRASVLTGA
ncbi:suppressor of fused domain protein [Microbacterium sp.]|uniref:suppressor of fused domain protein n=1 Tax=Microbacterium sp. TaxID=51671 RepID=UPI0026078249|nr:suppressor of fused domain protein [Microbacterium sp.]